MSATWTDLLLLLLLLDVVPGDLQADGGRRGRGHRLLPPLRRGGGDRLVVEPESEADVAAAGVGEVVVEFHVKVVLNLHGHEAVLVAAGRVELRQRGLQRVHRVHLHLRLQLLLYLLPYLLPLLGLQLEDGGLHGHLHGHGGGRLQPGRGAHVGGAGRGAVAEGLRAAEGGARRLPAARLHVPPARRDGHPAPVHHRRLLDEDVLRNLKKNISLNALLATQKSMQGTLYRAQLN